jgi:hypothetical protein
MKTFNILDLISVFVNAGNALKNALMQIDAPELHQKKMEKLVKTSLKKTETIDCRKLHLKKVSEGVFKKTSDLHETFSLTAFHSLSSYDNERNTNSTNNDWTEELLNDAEKFFVLIL